MKERDESQQEEAFLFSESQKKGIDENIEKLEKWINEETTDTFSFQENNSYKRCYYYNYLEKHHQQLSCDTIKTGNGCVMKVMRFNEAQSKAYQQEKKKTKLDKFENEKGFTKVFEMISESKIPIVGHNCFFDLLFWMRHFHDTLSPSYTKFKRSLNKYFPFIYDTKFIGNNGVLKKDFEKGSSLSDYHKSILNGKLKMQNLEFIIPPGFEGYRLDILEDEGKIIEEGKVIQEAKPEAKARYHEAGYDAFLTGISFLHFEKALNMKSFEKSFINKLNLMSSFFHLNIAGKDEFKQSASVFVAQDNSKKDFKKAHRDIEFAFKDIEESVWVRPSFYDYEHPIFISFKDGNGNSNNEQLSEDLSNYFNIQNKKKQMFFKVLFHLKSEGYNVMSFGKYVEMKIKGSQGKKKTEEIFDI